MRLRSLANGVTAAFGGPMTIAAAIVTAGIGGYAYAASTVMPATIVHTVTVPAPVDDTTTSVSWVTANAHPTAHDVAECGDWVPSLANTRQGGVLVTQAICAPPQGDAARTNDAFIAGIIG